MPRSKILIDTPEYTYPKDRLLHHLGTSKYGLHEKDAVKRLKRYGHNVPASDARLSAMRLLVSKVVNPLAVLLLIIAIVSVVLGQFVSAVFVGLMVLLSVVLSFVQEYRSHKAAERLRDMVRTTATVLRDHTRREIDIKDLVPGDVVELNAGDIVPADIRLLFARELFINESALTGESLPVEKFADPSPHHKSTELEALAFMGSSIVSGSGLGVVVKTGLSTQFGQISRRLTTITTSTSFEKGVTSFSWLMIRIIIVLTGVIFIINYIGKGDIVQAVLFALAVAVGLTPEMLPVLITVNLSKGAIAMADKKAIVKKLNAIQNFGAMDILCTDKTGTLTENKIILEKYCDIDGEHDKEVLRWAYINSHFHTGLHNLLDKAILAHTEVGHVGYRKIDEIPFDFQRRMMSVVMDVHGTHRLITKGAPEEVFKRCTHYEHHGKIRRIHGGVLSMLREEFTELSNDGLMVLAVAYRDFSSKQHTYGRDDERKLILRGYVAFLDPPKASATKTLKALQDLGISIKVLTGDNELVTKKICTEVGLAESNMLVGDAIDRLNDAQLRKVVDVTTIFARLSPLQKERVIKALRQQGHTVGYLGDGINDAPALAVSDVSISVNNAVDVAKESADIILLEKDLMVLRNGVVEGRKVFGNITKYIRMGASSNFGNMFSMTVGSFLPFLPMAPLHILLNNFLYDTSQVTIPTDNVDKEYLQKPRPWDIKGIRRFIYFIGPLSSIFDIITFGVMWFVFHASAPLFQTGWFIESLCTQTLVVHVIRTNKIPFIESRPSGYLLFSTLAIVAIGIILVISPLGALLGFVRPPAAYFVILAVMVLCYLFLVHRMKAWFVRKYALE